MSGHAPEIARLRRATRDRHAELYAGIRARLGYAVLLCAVSAAALVLYRLFTAPVAASLVLNALPPPQGLWPLCTWALAAVLGAFALAGLVQTTRGGWLPRVAEAEAALWGRLWSEVMASTLRAGAPLTEALQAALSTLEARWRPPYARLNERVARGQALAEALEEEAPLSPSATWAFGAMLADDRAAEGAALAADLLADEADEACQRALVTWQVLGVLLGGLAVVLVSLLITFQNFSLIDQAGGMPWPR
jgi:hypothetical protein